MNGPLAFVPPTSSILLSHNQLGSTFVIAIWQGVLSTNAFTSAAKCF